MEGGLPLPSVWSGAVRELAWAVVGQFPGAPATVLASLRGA